MSSDRHPIEMHVTASGGSRVENVQQIVVNRPAGVGIVPFRVPPLPPHFVPRAEIESNLLSAVCNKSEAHGVLVAGAVHGIGGLGKSTLAARLAHTLDVQARFPDGILWATLGQEPDLPARLSDWVRELGDYEFQFTTLDSVTGHLRTLLRGKSCLLIIDDAWQASHVTPFLVAGSPSQVLITTRISDIARSVGAELFKLDVMSGEQSLELITKKLKRPFRDGEREDALSLARELGYLPLALHLGAAQIEMGATWDELLNDLRCEVARLERLKVSGRLAEYGSSSEQLKDYSLLASFNLSVRRLDEVTRQRFAWLGILVEDSTFNARIVETLWDTSGVEANEYLSYLADKALLYEAGTTADGRRQYRMHDLLHDTARIILTSAASPDPILDTHCYGMALEDCHSKLLANYLKKSGSSEAWHLIPDDGYFRAYVTHHIAKSRRPELIHVLLAETGIDKRNGWFSCRESQGQIANYIRDVTQALEAVGPASSAEDLTLTWRYILILATLNSLAERLPSELVFQLAQEEIWTVFQALTYIRRMSEQGEKAEALVKLITTGKIEGEEKGIACAEAIALLSTKYDSGLILQIAGEYELPRRLEICRKILVDNRDNFQFLIDEFVRLGVITQLIPDLLDYATQAPDGDYTYSDQGRIVTNLGILRAVIHHVPEHDKKDILDASRKLFTRVKPWLYGSDAEARLYFAEIAFDSGVTISAKNSNLRLRSVFDMVKRAKLQLSAVRIAKTEADRSKRRSDAMDTLLHINQKKECVSTICELATQFDRSQAEILWRHALDVANSLDRATERAEYLARSCGAIPMDSVLAKRAKSDALEAVKSIKEEDSKNIALSEIAIRLGDASRWDNLDDPVLATQSILSPETKMKYLCRLSNCFASGSRSHILAYAVATVNELRDHAEQATALISAAEFVDEGGKTKLITNCIDLVQKAINLESIMCVKVIERMVTLGPDRIQIQAITAVAKKISDHCQRAFSLAAIAEQLATEDSVATIRAAYSAVKRISKSPRSEGRDDIFLALRRVAPLFNEAMLRECLSDLDKISWKYDYIHASRQLGIVNWIASIAPSLSRYATVWDDAIEIALELKDSSHDTEDDTWYFHYRDFALSHLVRFAPDERLAVAIGYGLSCKPVLDMNDHRESNVQMLSSLFYRASDSTRNAVIEKLLESTKDGRWKRSILDQHLIQKLLTVLLEQAPDSEQNFRHALSIFNWTLFDYRENILKWMAKTYPSACKYIKADIEREQSRVFTSSEPEEEIPWMTAAAGKQRKEVLGSIPATIGSVFTQFGEKGVRAIVESIEENASWWP